MLHISIYDKVNNWIIYSFLILFLISCNQEKDNSRYLIKPIVSESAINGSAQLLDYLSYGGNFFLSNFNNCVNTWGQNAIESSKEGAWLSPMGEVFRFFASQDDKFPLQSQLITDNVRGKDTSQENPIIEQSDVNFPLQVNRQSQTDLFKLQTCETNEGMNIYFINKSTEYVQLETMLPEGYQIMSCETLYGEDRLSQI